MNKTSKLILKTTAALMMLIGLTAMLVAWDLLLAANLHNTPFWSWRWAESLVCMAGYFLWRQARRPKKDL